MTYFFSCCKSFSLTSSKESPAPPPVPEADVTADGAVGACPSPAAVSAAGEVGTRVYV